MSGHNGFIPPFMSLAVLAEHICAGESTIEHWIKLGQFPGPSRKVGGLRLWRWKEVEKFLAVKPDALASPDAEGQRIYDATRAALAERH